MTLQNESSPALIEEFYDALSSGRAIHAYLIAGQQGIGKRGFAHAAAAAILCRDRRDTGPCGRCPDCAMTKAGSHPDMHALRPQKASIGVEEVRGLIDQLAIAAYQGGERVALIEQADRLTPQAQNALLKVLEEPSEGITWLLTASDISKLLPTVLSRCRIVRMPPQGDVVQRLIDEGADERSARELAFLSGGAYLRAAELMRSPDIESSRGKALSILQIKTRAQVPALWQSLREDKDIAPLILLWLESIVWAGLRASVGEPPPLALLSELPRFTFAQWKGMIEQVVLIRKKMGSNVTWNVAIEPLLWKIAEGEGT